MDDVIGIGAIVLTVAIVAIVAVYGVQGVRTQTACLKAGYPSSDVAFDLGQYCVKRVDQTDVVVPLSDVVQK